VEGYPSALTDYYILDLYMDSINTSIDIVKTSLADLIPMIGDSVLSEPIFIGKESSYEFFACINGHGELIVMQSKYYQYFKNKYPGCHFTSDGKLSPIGAKHTLHNNTLVGIFMPLQLTKEMYVKLCQNMEVLSAV
jgi:hypothetical protein